MYGLCQDKKDRFKEPHGINIYTDGSRMKDSTGSGVWCRGPHKISKYIALGSTPTVFQAEVYAIVAAANILTELEVSNKIINILTDSQAACKALAAVEIKSGIVEECANRLTALANCNLLGSRTPRGTWQ